MGAGVEFPGSKLLPPSRKRYSRHYSVEEGFDRDTNTCTQEELPNGSTRPEVIPMDVKVAKTQSNCDVLKRIYYDRMVWSWRRHRTSY